MNGTRIRACPALALAAAAAAAALVGMGGCERQAPPERESAVVLTLDTLRADHVGAYGYARDTTPQLDAFTRSALRFENATTATTMTLPSHASMFTGLYPAGHGALSNGWVLAPGRGTLAEILRAAGYRTAASVGAAWVLGRETGLGAGFEVYQQGEGSQRRAGVVVDEGIAFLDRVRREPFLLWLHFYDVHCGYGAPPPYTDLFTEDYEPPFDATDKCGKHFYNQRPLSDGDVRYLGARYDGELRYLDAELGRFFEALSERGLLDHTWVVIVSDHGEQLHEQGKIGHNFSLNEWESRIPFWIREPGAKRDDGRAVDAPVSSVDVMPTLLEVLGVADDRVRDGRSLAPLLAGAAELAPERPEVFARLSLEEQRADQIAVRTRRWKLLYAPESGESRLYDLLASPEERPNRAAERPEARDTLRDAARRWMERQDARRARHGDQQVGEETRERLRALGYAE